MEEIDAYAEGYDAWNCGKLDSDNPYDLEDQESLHMDWNDGWNDAAAELGEE